MTSRKTEKGSWTCPSPEKNGKVRAKGLPVVWVIVVVEPVVEQRWAAGEAHLGRPEL